MCLIRLRKDASTVPHYPTLLKTCDSDRQAFGHTLPPLEPRRGILSGFGSQLPAPVQPLAKPPAAYADSSPVRFTFTLNGHVLVAQSRIMKASARGSMAEAPMYGTTNYHFLGSCILAGTLESSKLSIDYSWRHVSLEKTTSRVKR